MLAAHCAVASEEDRTTPAAGSIPGSFVRASYTKARADLVALLLTGLPEGIIPDFEKCSRPTPADMLRPNVAVPPVSGAPSPLRSASSTETSPGFQTAAV